MFCFQCEQTLGGHGCTQKGVCGKVEEVAILLDLLVYLTKKISIVANKTYECGSRDMDIDRYVIESLFETITNVNFDPEVIHEKINEGKKQLKKIIELYQKSCDKNDVDAFKDDIPDNIEDQIKLGKEKSILKRKEKYGEEIVAMQELALYGIKGAAAYLDHALILLKDVPEIYKRFHEIISFIASESIDKKLLLDAILNVGKLNLDVMELLDNAHVENFGHPVPTKVRITPVKGKAILVSGHDLKDLEELLKQTEGKNINIYTHGEMLPAHGYPELNKYSHLVGNYGGAWQNQRKEFDLFPGSILMTTNCIQEPKESYKDRIFTKGMVGWPGVKHIENYDYNELIDSALKNKGFEKDEVPKYITVGFARNAVISRMDDILDKFKEKKISRIFLIGGCDGAKPGRNYYTEFAEKLPEDTLIFTLACGKYRFNKLSFGEIDSIPRLLDCGQCNDAFSAIAILAALKDKLNCEINDLPISYILSWFEQKAVAILLTLLFLGIKNIRLGPTLPAYFTPEIMAVLSQNFGLKQITSVDRDLKDIIK